MSLQFSPSKMVVQPQSKIDSTEMHGTPHPGGRTWRGGTEPSTMLQWEPLWNDTKTTQK